MFIAAVVSSAILGFGVGMAVVGAGLLWKDPLAGLTVSEIRNLVRKGLEYDRAVKGALEGLRVRRAVRVYVVVEADALPAQKAGSEIINDGKEYVDD